MWNNIATKAGKDQPSEKAADYLNTSIQESLLTALVHDDEHGRILADMVNAEEFEGDYAEIARRVLAYRQKYDKPPRLHLSDLLGDVINDPGNRKGPTYQRIVMMLVECADGLNAQFLVDEVGTFKRAQAMKRATLEAAERLNRGGAGAVEEIEASWQKLLAEGPAMFAPGLRITDFGALPANPPTIQPEFTTGIRELDRRSVMPARQKATLCLGATGRGKTWWMVHYGKHAIWHGKRVLHVTLEMSKEEVGYRYRQALFGVPRREGDHEVAVFGEDADEKLVISMEAVVPDFSLEQKDAQRHLEARMNWIQGKLNGLRIIQFPSGGLTVATLRACMRSLQQRESFVPDMLILDYVGIMQINSGVEYRHDLGRNLLGLRALAQDFDVALVTAQQANRIGAKADKLTHTHIAEDWSLTNTADQILAYSQKEDEHALGLARVYVAKNRGGEDQFEIAIAQRYALGQFALNSVPCDEQYRNALARLKSERRKADESDDDEQTSTRDRVVKSLKMGMKQKEIAEMLDISEARVSQIKAGLKT